MNIKSDDDKNINQEKNDLNKKANPQNYYDVIILKIEEKIKKNPKEALFEIEKELNAPFIPKDYEKIFQQKFYEAVQKYEEFHKELKLTPYECLDILLGIKATLKPLALAELRNYALKPFLNDIKKIFESKTTEIQIKASIYEFLCEQDIDFEFKIDNHKLNPLKNKSLVNNIFYQKNKKLIEEKTFKNPSLAGIATEIFNSYCAVIFPEGIILGDKDYSNEIIWISEKMLGISNDKTKTALCDKIYNKIFNQKLD